MAAHSDVVMIDKFGRLDDLEKMESILINPKVEEMTAKVLAVQARIQREEKEADDQLRDARDGYIEHMRENTKLTTKTLMLFNEMQAFTGCLNAYHKNPVGFFHSN